MNTPKELSTLQVRVLTEMAKIGVDTKFSGKYYLEAKEHLNEFFEDFENPSEEEINLMMVVTGCTFDKYLFKVLRGLEGITRELDFIKMREDLRESQELMEKQSIYNREILNAEIIYS